MTKKEEIIKTAFKLFYEKGIHAVGINEIIHAAGVAKKTLYNHFVSKDALIMATIEYHHQQFIGWLVSRIDQGETSKDALLIIFEALDDWFNDRVAGFESFRGCYLIIAALNIHKIQMQFSWQVKNIKIYSKALFTFTFTPLKIMMKKHFI